MSLWFGVLVYIFSYALPLLALNSSVLSMATAVRLTCITIPVVFLGGLLFPRIDINHLRKLSVTYTLVMDSILLLYIELLIGITPSSLKSKQLYSIFFYFLLGITFLLGPLRKLIENLVNHFIESGHSDYRTLLYNFSGRISSSLNLLRNGTHFFFCIPVPNDPKLSEELQEIRAAGFSLVYGLQGGSQFGGMLLLGSRKYGGGIQSSKCPGFQHTCKPRNCCR